MAVYEFTAWAERKKKALGLLCVFLLELVDTTSRINQDVLTREEGMRHV
jgi:hypothetical protein